MSNALRDKERVLDVWLRFEESDDEESSHEANTWATPDGFRVDWSHTAVGLIQRETFSTYREARAWLTANGYQDFTS